MKKNEKKNVKKEKNMINKKNIIIGAIVLGVLVVGILTYAVVDYFHDKKILEKSSIDPNSETYKGKKIEVKGNQVIIYEENGSKTIETVDDKKNDMKKATDSIKDNFKIIDVKIDKQAAKVIVTGNLVAKTKDYSKAVVSAKFYRDGEIVSTSSNTIDKIEKDKKYSFEMEFVGDYNDCTSKVEVEYVK